VVPSGCKSTLDGCFYYPAARFDGHPVKEFAGAFWSFFYVDYAVTQPQLRDELAERGFLGYRSVHARDLSARDLAPDGFSGIPVVPIHDHGRRLQRFAAPASDWFARWFVFERDADRDDSHGPTRFSLVYLCADGVAAYQAMFNESAEELLPGAIAVIQPGSGFGTNYTRFEKPRDLFHRTVAAHPRGAPELLVYGGVADAESYSDPCWPEYSEHLATYGRDTNGAVQVWRREAGAPHGEPSVR